jgi:hypothetical protein
VVVAKLRDIDDHIQWLLEQFLFEVSWRKVLWRSWFTVFIVLLWKGKVRPKKSCGAYLPYRHCFLVPKKDFQRSLCNLFLTNVTLQHKSSRKSRYYWLE